MESYFMSETLIVNLYAGPGTGKSTCMAGVFCELKLRGVNCEMAPEFAKEKVWENSIETLDDQIYVFGKQLHTIRRLLGKVDIIITDSPLLFSIHYGANENEAFRRLVVDVYHRYLNLDIFLERKKEYNPAGRLQTKEEAVAMDFQIKALLTEHNPNYYIFESNKENMTNIASLAHQKHLYQNQPMDMSKVILKGYIGEPICEIRSKYNELLYQVGKCFPNETRHETALRYLKNAETVVNGPAKCAIDS